jgi:hypothetical protein
MAWSFYLIAVLIFSFLVGSLLPKKIKGTAVIICLAVLLTPAQIHLEESLYSPALFTYFFNLFLERDYSLRVLRPIIITLPVSLFLLSIFLLIKKRFF